MISKICSYPLKSYTPATLPEKPVRIYLVSYYFDLCLDFTPPFICMPNLEDMILVLHLIKTLFVAFIYVFLSFLYLKISFHVKMYNSCVKMCSILFSSCMSNYNKKSTKHIAYLKVNSNKKHAVVFSLWTKGHYMLCFKWRKCWRYLEQCTDA